MNIKRTFTTVMLSLCIGIVATGCGDDNADPFTMTVDASSEKALDKSVQRIADKLAGEKKEEFLMAVEAIKTGGAMSLVSDAMQGNIPSNTVEASLQMQGNVREKLDGKTVDEIIAASQEISDAEAAFMEFGARQEGTYDPLGDY